MKSKVIVIIYDCTYKFSYFFEARNDKIVIKKSFSSLLSKSLFSG